MTTVEIVDDITIELPDVDFTPSEAAAGRWPEPLLPSEWAERHRVLYEDESDLRGPWTNDAAPYLTGMMNLGAASGIRRLTVKKAVQGGVSEAFRNVMGFWAEQDPAPTGLSLPNKDKGEQIVDNKVVPFFRRTRCLRRLFTARAHDVKKSEIRLANGFILYLMWSGSPTSMASNPMKRAISDETNKFAAWDAKDAGPIELIDKRLRTYLDAIHILISSPTTRHGVISVNFRQSSPQLYFLVPCPECGARQRLIWDQVKWSDEARAIADHVQRAEFILRKRCVWYECRVCGAHLNERQKRRMVRHGLWGTVGEDLVMPDGRITDAESVKSWPDGSWVGMHISALYWLWESSSLAVLAAEWFRAQGDPSKLFDFRTGTLGEDWEQQTAKVTVNTFSQRSQHAEHPENDLPWWCDRLIATIDTQADSFYLVIRAWGPGLLSQRVHHAQVESFEQLEQLCFHTGYKYPGDWQPPIACGLALIDTGGTRIQVGDEEWASRTQQVYAWCLKHRARVRPIKGASKARETKELFWPGRGVYRPHAASYRRNAGRRRTGVDVPLWLIDTHQAQDLLQELVNSRVELVDYETGELAEGDQWRLNRNDDATYNAHMANMHRIVDRDRGELVELWLPISDGARVDYRDCEAYQVAGAYMQGVHLLPPLATWRQRRMDAAKTARRPRLSGGVRLPDGRPFMVTQRG